MRLRSVGVTVAIALLVAAASAVLGVGERAGSTAPLPQTPSVTDWAWLKDTYWYVPAPNLPAYIYTARTQQLRAIADQTVYHITDYRAGYFWGPSAAKFGSGGVTCSALVGSVTPEGQVLLTFTPADPTVQTVVTQGFGTMRLRAGEWLMENQMSSGPNALIQIGHWAYMAQTRPDQASWQSLPGIGLSVPELLGQCPPGPQLVPDGVTPTAPATASATPPVVAEAPPLQLFAGGLLVLGGLALRSRRRR